ncbi:MAG: phospholipid carrier-dependent glycosyltransferase [Anaerolineales bacterium]|nr:phospholipid carrier-dependent glycosyltransferase [Anaerolineales bacterium]
MARPQKWGTVLALVIILLVAGWLRLSHLDWDGYRHFHPDERYIAWVATSIAWPTAEEMAQGAWLRPQETTLNPFFWPEKNVSGGVVVPQGEPRDFAYGHVSLYTAVGLARFLETTGGNQMGKLALATNEFAYLTAVGRLLTALVDVGTVLLIFLLGWRLTGRTAVGLLAAALLALNVMHIQLAHFFTVDPFMTFFVVAAVLALVDSHLSHGWRRTLSFAGAAVFVGLAVGSKFSAILLLLALALTAWLNWRRQAWRGLLVAGGLVLVSFALTNPFALLDNTCEVVTPAVGIVGRIEIPSIDWGNCYVKNVANQSAMVRGSAQFPFTRQYAGTVPFLYFMEMQGRWGMGPLLAVSAFVGFVGVLGWAVRGWWQTRAEDEAARVGYQAWLIVLAWCVPYFLSTGNFYVKFMRYWQPLTPFLMLFTAVLLLAIPWRGGRWVTTAVVVGSTAVWALAFFNMYQTPHPWLTTSRWFYENAPAGSLILYERWDEPLPTSLIAENERYVRTQYEAGELTWLSGGGAFDDEEKLRENLALLAEADYLVVASNRVYGVVSRLPEVYPLSSQVYPLLFSGALGYEPVLVAGRAPQVAGWQVYPDYFGAAGLEPPTAVGDFWANRAIWSPGRVDESFTVYDQPLTLVFANEGRLTAVEMAALFDLSPSPSR